MRIDCRTYGHWKDLLICSMSCPNTFRCKQFAQWKQEGDNQKLLWQRVMDYITKHPQHPYELVLTPLASNKTKAKAKDKIMKRFVCIREDEIALLSEEEITKKLLEGTMFDEIFELGRGMELQIRLVPAKKAKAKDKDNCEPVEKTEETKTSGRGKRGKKALSEVVN